MKKLYEDYETKALPYNTHTSNYKQRHRDKEPSTFTTFKINTYGWTERVKIKKEPSYDLKEPRSTKQNTRRVIIVLTYTIDSYFLY
jgi:hypothetical protein